MTANDWFHNLKLAGRMDELYYVACFILTQNTKMPLMLRWPASECITTLRWLASANLLRCLPQHSRRPPAVYSHESPLSLGGVEAVMVSGYTTVCARLSRAYFERLLIRARHMHS